MFKKSEEQEWTRFRGALSKDRDDERSHAGRARYQRPDHWIDRGATRCSARG